MLRTSLLCALTAVALAQTNIPARFGPGFPATGQQIMSGTVTLASGVMVRFKSVLTPASASTGSWGEGGISGRGNTVHRDMVDSSSKSYFGYALTIGPGGGADSLVATFGPLGDNLGNSLKPMALPKYPPPQVVHDGDIIELDLMASPDGKQKLTDYIQILAHAPEPAAAATIATPRDFTVDDGPVTFNAEQVTFLINGQRWQGMNGFTGRPGATFWMVLPGQGRYILSLTPHDGFTRSGAVRDNVISFQDAAQQYEVRSISPIAGEGRAWNLYMLHDPAYVPASNQREGLHFGTDRLENLLPRQ